MKTIKLQFDGYWLEEAKSGIPKESGVYCVYSCKHNLSMEEKRRSARGTVTIDRLLYIGESADVRSRIANHDRLDDWMDSLIKGQTLCYSFASVAPAERERAEAALIFEMQPPFNSEHTKEFIYNDTEIETEGKNVLLEKSFIVRKGAAK